MDKQDRLFYKKLKEIQLAHKPEKHEAIKPYNWKKEWGPIVKYDADWDGCYLLDLIIYKLEKMYLGLDIYSNEVRRDLDKKLKILRETIDLGKKVQSYNYYSKSRKFVEEHCAHVILIYEIGKSTSKDKPLHKIIKWKKDKKYLESSDPKDFIDNYFGETEVKNWALENGYDPKTLTKAYTGQWDYDSNHDIWVDMMKSEEKEEQKDTDNFFKLIAKNYRNWWW